MKKKIKKILIIENEENAFDVVILFKDNSIKTFYFNTDIRTANGVREGFILGVKFKKGDLELL